MLLTVVATLIAAFLVVATAGFVAFFVIHQKKQLTNKPDGDANTPRTPYLEELSSKLAALETTVKGLPSLWEEERERAKKHADRASAAYRGAESILTAIEAEDEDAGEDPDVYGDDEERGGDEGVRPLHDGVGVSAPAGDS